MNCIKYIFALVLLLAFSGCVTAPQSGRSQVENKEKAVFAGEAAVVAKRASERWAALVKHDLDAAWSYISPAGRSAFPLDVYKSRIKPLKWVGAEVKKVDCEAERCVVMLSLALDDVRTGPVDTIVTETWIRQESGWWFVYRG